MINGDLKDETPEDAEALAKSWLLKIAMSRRDHKSWIDDGRKVVQRYKSGQDEKKAGTQRKFNILYSNTEVIRAALYAKTAKPDVRRRNADKNPVAREAAEVLERGLIYCADVYAVDTPIRDAIKDMLLPGRGICRVNYEPILGEKPVMATDMMGMPVETGEMEPFIAEQKLEIEYVFWEDFLCETERRWAKVNWIAFRHTMDTAGLKELIDDAPESSKTYVDVKDVPRNWQPEPVDGKEAPESLKKSEVWEVWDKREKQRMWLVEGCMKPLRIDPDPYGLEGFYPVPEPPLFYETSDSVIPEPEFHAYKDQADDLDEITTRISRLTRAMKRRGIYDKSIPELKRLATAGDNEFIGADNYASLAQKGGLAAAFQNEDIQALAVVLAELYKQRDQLVQSIYEVTGISDIVRGATKASETATAQQLKSQFGSLRLKERQGAVAEWIRGMYAIKAEIMAEHFEPDVLSEMTGIQVTPEMMQLLRSQKLRGYQVNIETDSTIFEDAAQEKQDRVEVVTAIGQFMTQALPVAQAMPQMAPIMFDVLGFMIRGFKGGRELEDKIDQLSQQVQEQLAQPQQPQPDPEMEKAKAESEMRREEHQMDMQGKVIDLQVHQAKAQTDLQKVAAQAEADMARQLMPQQEASPGA